MSNVPPESTRAANDGEQVGLFSWCDCVPSSPAEVAAGLRAIADRIEADNMCLVSIYVTGYGEPWEACLQVIIDGGQ